MNCSTNLIKLNPGAIHLWFCFHNDQGNTELNELYFSLLSSKERAKHKRFRFFQDRYRYLLTRATVRTVLSRYAPLPPKAWKFTSNDFGRPQLIDPGLAETRGLSFNLTHTKGLIVLGIARGAEIGVDAESLKQSAMFNIAENYFTNTEVAALRNLPPDLMHHRFFALWTLKESYIKARGMGLSIPLDQFGFNFDRHDGCINVNFSPELEDAPENWVFFQLKPSSEHIVSVCAERFGSEPNKPVCRKIIPLTKEYEVNMQYSQQSR